MTTETIAPTINEMRVLDHTGDTKIEWNPRRGEETNAAREMFDKLKKRGYLAYKLKRDGTQGEVIREFDPSAERIVMSPAMQGG